MTNIDFNILQMGSFLIISGIGIAFILNKLL